MATITTILATDNPKDSRSVINTNFSNLNTDKVETSALTAWLATKQDTITWLTASGAELNILDGAIITTTELNYVDWVTSYIQSQLNAKQGWITLTTTGSSGAATLVWDTLNIPQYSGGGTGDVVWPASATDNAIARFDTTTGKLIQNSAATIADTTWDITAWKYNTVAISGTSTPTIAITWTVTISGTHSGTSSGTNSGDQTSIAWITGTMAQFDTAVSDWNLVYQSQALGTPASGTLTNCTSLPVAWITASTSTALGVGSIELWHATDTSITRVSAWVIAVEGATIPTLTSTSTFSTGIKTFLAGMFALRNVANTFNALFTNTNTADRTYTLQNRNWTLADDTDLLTKADDNNTVHRNGVETITAVKTFNDTTLSLRNVANTFSGVFTNTITAARTWTLPDSNTTVPIISQQLTVSWPTAARTITLPDTSFTVARTDAAQTFTWTQIFSQQVTTNNAIAATGNAATVPITSRISTVTNNSAATLTITLTTASAVDGMLIQVRVLDFSAVAQTLTWVNTENGEATVPATSNGSTTLPRAALFQYNSATSKFRCIAS